MSEGSRSCGCLVETNRVLHVPNESGGTNDIPCEDWCVTHDTRHIDCELKETLHALHHHTDCNAAQKERELVKLYREKSLELVDLLGRHAAHIRELMQQYDLNSSAGKGTPPSEGIAPAAETGSPKAEEPPECRCPPGGSP